MLPSDRTTYSVIKDRLWKLPMPAHAKEAYDQIVFMEGVPYEMIQQLQAVFGPVWTANPEGYLIFSKDRIITVTSPSGRGLFYGAIELAKMLTSDPVFPECMLYDYPDCDVRGLKVFLPAYQDLAGFYQTIDLLCEYKHNTVMIEIGGAMEYRSHPEINAGWVEYCKDIRAYSGRSIEIQESFDWAKNSIHVDNGGGSYLSQSVVRTLVQYCKDRFLNVIPEVPSLSHCDYLLLGNPDIRERTEDPYPDTVCPSNPKTYQILFDILEEIIDVFKPSKINMGHDEYYSIGLCPRCKNIPAWKLFADDIHRYYCSTKQGTAAGDLFLSLDIKSYPFRPRASTLRLPLSP